jgi:hypothetical protein
MVIKYGKIRVVIVKIDKGNEGRGCEIKKGIKRG